MMLVAAAALAAPMPADAQEKKTVQITVLAILATDQSPVVDPRLQCIAQKVQKLKPSLTGFQLKRTTSRSVEEGKEYKIPLVDREVVLVTVEHGADKKNRIGLSVKPPQMGEITYNCCCGKYLPIWTDYKTKKKESLIIAIMVSPCNDECPMEPEE
jgi:hypothetical protein